MPDWLTKAQATITGGRIGSDDLQPFERQCTCGEILCGERTPAAQQIVCSQCGRAWFVLPRDPYPRSRARRAKPSFWKRWAGSATGGQEAASASAGQKGAGVSQQTVSLASDKTREIPRKSPAVPLRQRIKSRLSQTKTATRERLRKAARPMRLIAAGMLAALLVTGLWLWHRARVDEASATIVSLEPRAEQAIADGDFAAAERDFSQLVAAVETLGATDQTAQRVRQRYRESVAINNLAAQSPYDLAAEADKFVTNADEWSERFRAISAGRWVVLDVNVNPLAPVTAVERDESEVENNRDEGERKDVVLLDMPLVVGKFPVRFEMDASVFERLKLPTRAIFAAQYASWQLRQDGTRPPVWVVRFRPGSAFLWASSDTYAAMGFELDPPAAPPRAALEQQARMLGLEAQTEPQDPKSATRKGARES